jgi:hypothetical protein
LPRERVAKSSELEARGLVETGNDDYDVRHNAHTIATGQPQAERPPPKHETTITTPGIAPTR